MKGFLGKVASRILYHIIGLDSLNGYYGDVSGLYGPAFSEGVLKEMGIKYEALPEQEGYIPAEGGFITVSNHPFGGAEGLILNAIVGSKRSDFKILTTFLLSKIRNLAYWFIPVDNFSTGGTKSISGIREALDHLASGHPLGLFPAGEVSTWQKKGLRTAISGKRVVEDKPWADNIIKIIKNSGLPVVPVYFDGANSNRFHTLGRIHPMLRTVRLARELMNKKGTTVKVRIGKPISAEDIANLEIKELGKYLRNRCYALEAQCSLPSRNVSNIGLNEIAPPVDPELV
ncbi:MAG: lysophospholipid acyltransferase family protein, partial [Bacteroidales bacterium]|nr:lysophospholipid acyltransferase family protein [Bacteroidales bacterium]